MRRSGNNVILIFMVITGFVLLVSGCAQRVQRYGMVIGIEKENIAEYKRLAADVWPGVLSRIKKSNIRNYSIYLGEVEKDRFYLFSYFEYTGDDFEADMARMARDKTTQEWCRLTDPLQRPLATRKEGQRWARWQEVFHYAGAAVKQKKPKRFGSVIGLKNDRKSMIAYVQLHSAVWPGVLAAIERAHIRNYSIYMGQVEPGKFYLFSYFEYYGDDYKADMEKIAQDEVTQVWWTYTDPLQQPVPTRKEGQWWASMEEVFHTD